MMLKLFFIGLVCLITACGVGATTTCHARSNGQLPDPTCTPGVVNPDVTQTNIQQTICVRGWTATVRPPVSYTNALKRKQISQYGYTDKNLRYYEEDHLIPLELGGNPVNPKNLWPEPGASPNPKDRVEGRLRRAVCDGMLSLRAAQREIATNWMTASA